MTTLSEAQQTEQWTIPACLVGKLIFVKRHPGHTTHTLVLVFIDINGQQFEIKTWSTRTNDRRSKIFTVYRKMEENHFYEIQATSSGHHFRPTKPEFSTSKLEYSFGWWLNPIENLRMNRSLECSTSIKNSLNALQQERAVNLMGSFLGYKEGPPAHIIRGVVNLQGYFVLLLDEDGRKFTALIWHSVRIDRRKCSLFGCERGDPVLILSARLMGSAAKETIYIKTVNRPLVNSDCVSPRRISALRQAFNNHDS